MLLNNLKTNGFYHFRHQTKSAFGEPIQVDYIFIFQEIPPPIDIYNYRVYFKAEIDVPTLPLGKIIEAVNSIKKMSYINGKFLGDEPDEFESMFGILEKRQITFIEDRMVEKAKYGTRNIFTGTSTWETLILTYIFEGFDLNGNLQSAINFKDSVFRFQEIKG